MSAFKTHVFRLSKVNFRGNTITWQVNSYISIHMYWLNLILRKSAKENINEYLFPSTIIMQLLMIVMPIFQEGAIKPLQRKRVQQHDITKDALEQRSCIISSGMKLYTLRSMSCPCQINKILDTVIMFVSYFAARFYLFALYAHTDHQISRECVAGAETGLEQS